jgi:hypothetical protein
MVEGPKVVIGRKEMRLPVIPGLKEGVQYFLRGRAPAKIFDGFVTAFTLGQPFSPFKQAQVSISLTSEGVLINNPVIDKEILKGINESAVAKRRVLESAFRSVLEPYCRQGSVIQVVSKDVRTMKFFHDILAGGGTGDGLGMEPIHVDPVGERSNSRYAEFRKIFDDHIKQKGAKGAAARLLESFSTHINPENIVRTDPIPGNGINWLEASYKLSPPPPQRTGSSPFEGRVQPLPPDHSLNKVGGITYEQALRNGLITTDPAKPKITNLEPKAAPVVEELAPFGGDDPVQPLPEWPSDLKNPPTFWDIANYVKKHPTRKLEFMWEVHNYGTRQQWLNPTGVYDRGERTTGAGQVETLPPDHPLNKVGGITYEQARANGLITFDPAKPRIINLEPTATPVRLPWKLAGAYGGGALLSVPFAGIGELTSPDPSWANFGINTGVGVGILGTLNLFGKYPVAPYIGFGVMGAVHGASLHRNDPAGERLAWVGVYGGTGAASAIPFSIAGGSIANRYVAPLLIVTQVAETVQTFDLYHDDLFSGNRARVDRATSAIAHKVTIGFWEKPVAGFWGTTWAIEGTVADIFQGNGVHPINNFRDGYFGTIAGLDEADRGLEELGVNQFGRNFISFLNDVAEGLFTPIDHPAERSTLRSIHQDQEAHDGNMYNWPSGSSFGTIGWKPTVIPANASASAPLITYKY